MGYVGMTSGLACYVKFNGVPAAESTTTLPRSSSSRSFIIGSFLQINPWSSLGQKGG